jgi:hypothetical protein
MIFRNRDLDESGSLIFYSDSSGSTMGALFFFQKAAKHFHCQPCIVTIHRIVAREHDNGLVARQLHNDRHVNSSLSEVCVEDVSG